LVARYIDLKYAIKLGGIFVSPKAVCVLLCVLWTSSASIWLAIAYMLEFHGWSLFLQLWIAALLFHLVNVLCIAFVIVSVKDSTHGARGHKVKGIVAEDDSDKD